jgi:hypothetical protein
VAAQKKGAGVATAEFLAGTRVVRLQLHPPRRWPMTAPDAERIAIDWQ